MKAFLLILLAVGIPLGLLLFLSRDGEDPPAAVEITPRVPASVPATELPPTTSLAPAPPPRSTVELPTIGELAEQLRQAMAPPAPGDPAAAAAQDLAEGRYAAAERGFDRVLAAKPNDVGAMMGKAVALAGLGRGSDAVPLLEWVGERSIDADEQFRCAIALISLREGAAAQRILSRMVTADPKNRRARFHLALLEQASGNRSAALEHYRLLTDPKAGPENKQFTPVMADDAWWHRGELALDAGKPQEAEGCYRTLTERHPDSPLAWCNLGIALARQVERDKALAALEKALQLDANLLPALNQTAYIHAARFRNAADPEDGRAALECCRRSLAVRSDQPNIRSLWVALLEAAEQSAAPEAEEP